MNSRIASHSRHWSTFCSGVLGLYLYWFFCIATTIFLALTLSIGFGMDYYYYCCRLTLYEVPTTVALSAFYESAWDWPGWASFIYSALATSNYGCWKTPIIYELGAAATFGGLPCIWTPFLMTIFLALIFAMVCLAEPGVASLFRKLSYFLSAFSL